MADEKSNVESLLIWSQLQANPQRGRDWHWLACRFLERFQAPADITETQLDAFLVEILEDPEFTSLSKAAGGTPERTLYCERRRRMVWRLGRSGSHPRLNDAGFYTFTLESNRRGLWLLRHSLAAVKDKRRNRPVVLAIENYERKQQYFFEGLDPDRLTEAESLILAAIWKMRRATYRQMEAMIEHLSDLFDDYARAFEAKQMPPDLRKSLEGDVEHDSDR